MSRAPSTISTLPSITTDLQSLLLGKRSRDFSGLEINTLFRQPITKEFNILFLKSLQRKVIDPDIAILQIIPQLSQQNANSYLIPFALCLRFGADPNMYVNAPNIGIIHILGYVYYVLGDNSISDQALDNNTILNTVVLLLIAKGSRSSSPIFDNTAGKIKSEREISTTPSVLEWLHTNEYSTILDQINTGDPSELKKFVTPDSLTIISILLDMPQLMSRQYKKSDSLLAIRSFNTPVLSKIPITDEITGMDYKSLDDSSTYFNVDAYETFINVGQMPSYILINKIILGIRNNTKLNNLIPAQELEKMLLMSLESGYQLDQEQLSLITAIGPNILKTVNQIYEIPYWRKTCRVPASFETPLNLQKLAFSLNIDPTLTKANICENIATLSKADKETLKAAARKRQQLRISADLGKINEFVGDKIPNLTCRNRTLLSHDPLDYNDIDLAYYRDEQGSVWCFSSDNFQNLLETGVNPYTSVSLPETFKQELISRLDLLHKLGFNTNSVSFSDALDSLSVKDTISNKYSIQRLNDFKELALTYNVPSDVINSSSKETLMNALQTIDYNVDLNPLTQSHALITTSYIIDYTAKHNPESLGSFFEFFNLVQ